MADILKITEQLSLHLSRNGANFLNQNFSPADADYTRHAADRVVLAANMGAFQQVALNDIGVSLPGEHLYIEADRTITIAINDTAKEVRARVMVLVGASITALFLKNTDANNTATVEYVVTD